jgi:hypothetical protein
LPLVSGTRYTDTSGQSFTVTRLNYFVSNVKLRNKETGDYYHELDSYHLVHALSNPGNTEIILRNIPRKKFSEMELSIGVDNSSNHSTDRQGDLDPGNGMAWDWKTGYKFFELEGQFTSGATNGKYLFHVGEDVCYRTMTFSFKEVLSNNLDVVKDGQILLEAEVASVLGQPNPVDLTVTNDVMSAATGGLKISENYARAFFKLVGAQ